MEMPRELVEQMGQMTTPQVKVVDSQGNPASIDNYDAFMSFIMLSSVNAQLYKMRKLMEDKDSNGHLLAYDEAVTNTMTEIILPEPCQSVSLINTGPDSVRVWLNHRANYPRIVRVNVPLSVDFGGHKLTRIYLQCSPGQQAQVEIAVKH